MRVQTGTTYTRTLTKKSFITYKCCKCGCKQVGEYPVEVTGVCAVSVLQNTNAKLTENEAAMQADALAADYTNKTEVNDKRNFMALNKPVKCKECGDIQPWSDMTEHPEKTKLSPQLIALCIIVGICGLSGMLSGEYALGLFLLPAVALVGYYFYKKKTYERLVAENEKTRKEAINLFMAGGNEMPKYYCREDIPELLKSSYASEFAELVKGMQK